MEQVSPEREWKPAFAAQNWLACIRCGHTEGLLEARIFTCPSCGGLYEVAHDYSTLQRGSRLIEELRLRLAGSPGSPSPGFRSGVWAFQPLIMPGLPASMVVTLGERVQIVEAPARLVDWVGGDVKLYVALLGLSPTGSFKDFGMTVLASVAKAAGVRTLVCASTGDTSAAAAAYAAAGGMQCAVLLPKGKVSAVQLVQPLAYGAKVIVLPTDFDGCMKALREIVAHEGGYPANSIQPTRIEGHQATVFTAWTLFNRHLPDWIVAPVGNGSNVSSLGKAMRTLADLGLVPFPSRILGCQAEKAAPLADSWRQWRAAEPADDHDRVADLSGWREAYAPRVAGETLATAARIGSPVSWEKVVQAIGPYGAMDTATDDEIREAVYACGASGHLVCPQTGIALAGLKKGVQRGLVRKHSSVLVVSTATGLKFPEVLVPLQGHIVEAESASTSEVARLIG